MLSMNPLRKGLTDEWYSVAAKAAKIVMAWSIKKYGRFPFGSIDDLAQCISEVIEKKFECKGPATLLTYCVAVGKKIALGEFKKKHVECLSELVPQPEKDEEHLRFMESALNRYLQTIAQAATVLNEKAERKQDRKLILVNPGRALNDMVRHVQTVNGGDEMRALIEERAELWDRALDKDIDHPMTLTLCKGVALRDLIGDADASLLLERAFATVHSILRANFVECFEQDPAKRGKLYNSLEAKAHRFYEKVNRRALELFEELKHRVKSRAGRSFQN